MSRTTYAYKTIFEITNENSLDDFWSFVMFRLDVQTSEYAYDRLARLYNRLSNFKEQLSDITSIVIQLEESDSHYAISITTKIADFIEATMRRFNTLSFDYTYEDSCFSYEIDKRKNANTGIVIQTIPTHKNLHTFIEEEDYSEMQNILEKIKDANYATVYKQFCLDELNAYRSTLSYYSSYLKHYSELSVMSNITAELSVILSLYSEKCLLLSNDFRSLLETFVNNLEFWQYTLFSKGSESLNFMDNSFQADLNQIKMALELYDDISEAEEYELEDIFEF